MLEAVGIVLLIGTLATWGWQGAWRQRRLYEDAFAKLIFDTPRGLVTGQSLRVVHRSVTFPQSEPEISGAADPGAVFWFCVGPGPTYFLAMPIRRKAEAGGLDLQWIVRQLTAERMRGALAARPSALRRAFPEPALSE